MSLINFDIDKALGQARELEDLSEELERMIKSSYEPAMQTLSGSWRGESASAFLKKGSRMQEKMEKTAKEIRGTAESIRVAVKIVSEAEMRAKELTGN